MWHFGNIRRWSFLGLCIAVVLVHPLTIVQAQPMTDVLQIVATTSDLGSLAQAIGGNHVRVTTFAKGTEDPHFVEPKPSFIKVLSQADMYIQMGMDLESGWAPTLLKQARNAQVLPGARGYVNASTVIKPLQIPAGQVDRSMGDVHAQGNPHYLLDPIQGLRVVRLIRDKLIALQPQHRSDFETRYSDFQKRLGTALVGGPLTEKYDIEKLALLSEHGRLRGFLESQQESHLLDGWLGRLMALTGVNAVADHNTWPYFAQRFRINIVGFMEPKPGVPPTTRHLRQLIKTMRQQSVQLVLSSAYFDPRHARFLSQKTGASIAAMANQVGARTGTDTYIDMIDYNVRQLIVSSEKG